MFRCLPRQEAKCSLAVPCHLVITPSTPVPSGRSTWSGLLWGHAVVDGYVQSSMVIGVVPNVSEQGIVRVKGYTVGQRRQWLRWHEAHGRDVSATCRHFGISRTTFYRWSRRYERDHSRESLQDRSRRPRTVRQPRKPSNRDLLLISDLVWLHPEWGRGRIHRILIDLPGRKYSLAGVGRMLHEVRTICPRCRHVLNGHDDALHICKLREWLELLRHACLLLELLEPVFREPQAQL